MTACLLPISPHAQADFRFHRFFLYQIALLLFCVTDHYQEQRVSIFMRKHRMDLKFSHKMNKFQ